MPPNYKTKSGQRWTPEDCGAAVADLLTRYQPVRIGTGAGGMRETEFCKVPARFPGVSFDRVEDGWRIALEKLRRGFDPAKMGFDRWIESTQYLGSLKGKRPDHLDLPRYPWTDADRAETLEYVGGNRNEGYNRKYFARLVVARIRLPTTDTKFVRVDKLIRWKNGDCVADEFSQYFAAFDPGYGTFELWWLKCLCDWMHLRRKKSVTRVRGRDYSP